MCFDAISLYIWPYESGGTATFCIYMVLLYCVNWNLSACTQSQVNWLRSWFWGGVPCSTTWELLLLLLLLLPRSLHSNNTGIYLNFHIFTYLFLLLWLYYLWLHGCEKPLFRLCTRVRITGCKTTIGSRQTEGPFDKPMKMRITALKLPLKYTLLYWL